MTETTGRPTGDRGCARDRGTETEEGYLRLRQAIVRGQFLPNERLIETDLARTFRVGRAAIRTALARLEQEGLVEREPFRGARVRAISVEEAIEILEARAALEGLAVRQAARNATPDDVAGLRATLEQMRADHAAGDLLRVSEGNRQLHRQLLAIARHRTAARLIDVLQAQNVRYQFRTILVPGRASQSLEEHRAIVDAVAAGDPDRAEHAVRRHLDHVADALRRLPAARFDHAGSI
jgi:DNA-binding GntR family transcriptional regulator